MGQHDTLSVEEELKARVHSLNIAWLAGNLDDLRTYFHPEIVMVAPGVSAHIKGREACLKSFEDFMCRAQVHDFRESETRVDHWVETAITSFRWDVTYTLDGRRLDEAGRDVWVWIRTGGIWVVVWRTQFPIQPVS